MRRASLYSSSNRSRVTGRPDGADTASTPAADGARASDAATPNRVRDYWTRFRHRHDRALLVAAGVLSALLVVWVYALLSPSPTTITQRDIDAAVLHTLENRPPQPSIESVAYEIIRPSIVRVRRLDSDETTDTEQGVGTGVVIVDSGIILTNLHVVAGSGRVGVVFADGTESPADVVSVQPEHDLAVIQARMLPDDLIPATLRSTRDLRPGDRVVAVGYPFGIGPSLSAGVVSGLRRDYRTAEGERVLTNLIQFDAAANPGNSGGPLVTEDGQVVGIVTAILNPTEQRVFIGIGFAVPIENAAAGAGMSPF
jgi:S1-C subfamily serine protease